MSKDKEAIAEVATYFSLAVDVGLGFLVGYHTGNPFIVIGTCLVAFPVLWVMFAYVLAKMHSSTGS